MSLVVGTWGSDASPADFGRAAHRLVSTIDGFFPVGTPIPGAAFLDGVASVLDADRASLVLVRLTRRHRVLRVVDDLLRLAPTHHERAFTERVNNHSAWARDPVALQLYNRCRRRPAAHFVYTTRQLARRHAERPSYSLAFLDELGVRHEMTSLMPVADQLFSLLTIFRSGDASKPFVRTERRMLKLLHRVFAPRVIDVRLATIRQTLPASLRRSFAMLLSGHSEKEIARATHRSHNTIHDHVKRIYQHFGVASRAQLMARFIDVSREIDHVPRAQDASVTPGEA